VVNAFARAAVSDQREWGSGRGWAAQALSEGIIHNVAHSLVPLGRAEFRLTEEIVIYDEGCSHTYDHIYAGSLTSSFGPFSPGREGESKNYENQVVTAETSHS
jgi:hypothetical protein